jgi:hypothetical protein
VRQHISTNENILRFCSVFLTFKEKTDLKLRKALNCVCCFFPYYRKGTERAQRKKQEIGASAAQKSKKQEMGLSVFDVSIHPFSSLSSKALYFQLRLLFQGMPET